MENFQITLIQIDDVIKFANTDYEAEKYILNNFNSYVENLSTSTKMRDGIFYDLNDVSEDVSEGWVVLRKKGYDQEMNLYKISHQNSGWFKSDTKRIFNLEKTATLKPIDSVDSPYCCSTEDDSSIPKENEKYEMCRIIRKALDRFETITGRENRITHAKEIFDILKTDKGKRFMYNHSNFKETVRNKLLEFIVVEKVEEFADYYEEIFGKSVYFLLKTPYKN